MKGWGGRGGGGGRAVGATPSVVLTLTRGDPSTPAPEPAPTPAPVPAPTPAPTPPRVCHTCGKDSAQAGQTAPLQPLPSRALLLQGLPGAGLGSVSQDHLRFPLMLRLFLSFGFVTEYLEYLVMSA